MSHWKCEDLKAENQITSILPFTFLHNRILIKLYLIKLSLQSFHLLFLSYSSLASKAAIVLSLKNALSFQQSVKCISYIIQQNFIYFMSSTALEKNAVKEYSNRICFKMDDIVKNFKTAWGFLTIKIIKK